jgi:hypothetical protein
MFNPQPATRLMGLSLALMLLLSTGGGVQAQGLVKGMQDGAQAGNQAAGPVGGVLGGAIGGVVGVFSGALGVSNDKGQGQAQPQPTNAAKPAASAKSKATKTAKASIAPATASAKPIEVLTQPGEPVLTAEQIVANSDSYIDRIRTQLNLKPTQEKNWSSFNSAMHYLGHNGAERLNLRIARAKRDPPDDIVEQMRNEPLFMTLDDKQKTIFIEQMVRLSHERGLD